MGDKRGDKHRKTSLNFRSRLQDHLMPEETNRCPKCGGEAVPIIYGLVPVVPGGSRPVIFKAHDRGELRWGAVSSIQTVLNGTARSAI